jgi:hypothetical protein
MCCASWRQRDDCRRRALYADVGGREMCVIQKEYPTQDSIGRSRRQHWDVAVIKTPRTRILPPSGGDR